MSILYPLSKEEIEEGFNVKGFFLGFVPVYANLDDDYPDDLFIVERNGVPEWCIPVFATLWEGLVWIINLGGIFDGMPRVYPMLVTGDIVKHEKES